MAVSELERMLAAHRRQLEAQDLAWQRKLAKAYKDAIAAVRTEQAALARHVEATLARGGPESPSWLSREQRFLKLQSHLYQVVRQYGLDATQLTMGAAQDGAETGLPQTATELGAIMGVRYPDYGPGTWAVINQRAIDAGIALVEHEMSPLRRLLERDLPETAVAQFRSTWTNGLILGYNPNKIAKIASGKIETLTLGRAQLIARTEFHRAYRAGKVDQFAQLTTVTGWLWRSALDSRTCGVCIGMHGTFHPKTEMLDGHPNCRCTMVPTTVDPYRLGTGATLEQGEDWFARQPADRQLAVLGPGRFKRYQEGMPLSSMIGQRQSPIWGSMRVLEPLGLRPRAGVGGASPPSGANPISTSRPGLPTTGPRLPSLPAPNPADSSWAINQYGGPEAYRINKALREGTPLNDVDARTVGGLDAAMAPLPEATVLWRGVGKNAIPDATVGRTFEEPGYSSTSVAEGVARDYADYVGGYVLKIEAPAGTQAIRMTDSERVLARNTKFRVVAIREVDGITQITLRIMKS